MRKFLAKLKSNLGQSMIEYAVLLSIALVAIVFVMPSLNSNLHSLLVQPGTTPTESIRPLITPTPPPTPTPSETPPTTTTTPPVKPKEHDLLCDTLYVYVNDEIDLSTNAYVDNYVGTVSYAIQSSQTQGASLSGGVLKVGTGWVGTESECPSAFRKNPDATMEIDILVSDTGGTSDDGTVIAPASGILKVYVYKYPSTISITGKQGGVSGTALTAPWTLDYTNCNTTGGTGYSASKDANGKYTPYYAVSTASALAYQTSVNSNKTTNSVGTVFMKRTIAAHEGYSYSISGTITDHELGDITVGTASEGVIVPCDEKQTKTASTSKSLSTGNKTMYLIPGCTRDSATLTAKVSTSTTVKASTANVQVKVTNRLFVYSYAGSSYEVTPAGETFRYSGGTKSGAEGSASTGSYTETSVTAWTCSADYSSWDIKLLQVSKSGNTYSFTSNTWSRNKGTESPQSYDFYFVEVPEIVASQLQTLNVTGGGAGGNAGGALKNSCAGGGGGTSNSYSNATTSLNFLDYIGSTNKVSTTVGEGGCGGKGAGSYTFQDDETVYSNAIYCDCDSGSIPNVEGNSGFAGGATTFAGYSAAGGAVSTTTCPERGENGTSGADPGDGGSGLKWWDWNTAPEGISSVYDYYCFTCCHLVSNASSWNYAGTYSDKATGGLVLSGGKGNDGGGNGGSLSGGCANCLYNEHSLAVLGGGNAESYGGGGGGGSISVGYYQLEHNTNPENTTNNSTWSYCIIGNGGDGCQGIIELTGVSK